MSTTSTQLMRVKARLDELDLSSGVFAKACGISASTLSTALRGGTTLSGPLEAKLAEHSLRLVEVAAAIRPLALPSHADMLKEILEHVQQHPDSIAELGAAVRNVFKNSSDSTVD
jgi:hypothetical protein